MCLCRSGKRCFGEGSRHKHAMFVSWFSDLARLSLLQLLKECYPLTHVSNLLLLGIAKAVFVLFWSGGSIQLGCFS